MNELEKTIQDFGEFLREHNVCGIKKMDYVDNGFDEIITITYLNNYKKQINVTLDREFGKILRDLIQHGGI